jgi:hypothetical protein
MRGRVLLGGLLVVVCLVTLWGVWGQRSQLAGLRAEQQQLLAQVTARADGAASPGTAAPPALVVTPELLRLRNEVTRLTERRHELAGERSENEQLRAQLASRATNGAGGNQPPAGYMRKSEARMVGYNSPDDTLQSLLWAVQNHDLTNVLQAFAPDIAAEIRARLGESPQALEDLWGKSAMLVGMRIVSRVPDPSDGSMAVDLEMVPGESGPHTTFRLINGQWKLAGGF